MVGIWLVDTNEGDSQPMIGGSWQNKKSSMDMQDVQPHNTTTGTQVARAPRSRTSGPISAILSLRGATWDPLRRSWHEGDLYKHKYPGGICPTAFVFSRVSLQQYPISEIEVWHFLILGATLTATYCQTGAPSGAFYIPEIWGERMSKLTHADT